MRHVTPKHHDEHSDRADSALLPAVFETQALSWEKNPVHGSTLHLFDIDLKHLALGGFVTELSNIKLMHCSCCGEAEFGHSIVTGARLHCSSSSDSDASRLFIYYKKK
jgi:hypothetical protein